MRCRVRYCVQFAPPNANAIEFVANITFANQSSELPYVRDVATVRIHQAESLRIPLRSWLHFADRRWRVIEKTDRPLRGWSTINAVYLEPTLTGGLEAWSGEIVVTERCMVPGLNARDEFVERFRTQAVIAKAKPTRDSYDKIAQDTLKLACYVSHEAAARIRPGWALHDGMKRFRVDDISNLDVLDKLPVCSITQTAMGV